VTRTRGVSLIEMMVALTVGGLALAIGFEALTGLGRAARARGERAGGQVTLRAVFNTVVRELEPLGADSIAGPDLAPLGPGSVTYRAHRGLYAACRIATDTLVIAQLRTVRWGDRLPVPVRDSALLYVPGDSTGPIDAWLPVPVVDGPFSATCPSGERALLYVTVLDSATRALRRLPLETLIRVFETAMLKSYGPPSAVHFGFEGLSASASVQPLAGPLPPSGVSFTGWTRAGLPVLGPDTVAVLDLVARAVTHRELAVGPWSVSSAGDSAATSVRLRNLR